MAAPTNDAAALAALLDRQSISDCLLRYARGVDRLDLSLIRSAFWDDAWDSHGPVNGSYGDFISFFLPRQADRQVAQHFVMNHLIELDGAAADSEAYFISVAKNLGQDDVELVGGRYVDRLEKRANEWRIKTRLVVLDWQCTADGAQIVDRLSRSHTGSRSASDPSYERPVRPRKTVLPSVAHDGR
jgi:hypothetical protein